MTFQIPLHFEDLTRSSADDWQIDPPSQREAPTQALLDKLADIDEQSLSDLFSVTSRPTSSFIHLFALILRYQTLSDAQRTLLLEIIQSITPHVTTTLFSSIHALKIALFFASGLVARASVTTPPCKIWDKSGREPILESIHALVSLHRRIAFNPVDAEQISAQLVRTTLHVLEQPKQQKTIRPLLARCVATALRIDPRQKLPTLTALLHALCRHEHVATPLADILHRLCLLDEEEEEEEMENETDGEIDPVVDDNPVDNGVDNENDMNVENQTNHQQRQKQRRQQQHQTSSTISATRYHTFVTEFIHEVARLPHETLVRDTSAAKTVSMFLCELVDRRPTLLFANLALVLSLLDVDAYTVRNGVIHVMAVLIRHDPKPDDPLLDVLLQRALRDAHAFTRSKALQSWIALVEQQNVPNRLFPVLAETAASRLDDRTAAVRKYAAQLLVTLLKCNPFGPALKLAHYRERLNEIRRILNENDDENEGNGDDDENITDAEDDDNVKEINIEHDDDDDDENMNEKDLNENDNRTDEGIENEEGGPQEQEGEEVSAAEIVAEVTSTREPTEEERQAHLKKNFYSTAVAFITTMEHALHTVFNMLRSKSVTDVAEGVSLVVVCVQFQLEIASGGDAVRKMLPLLLARETNLREKAVDAFVRLLAPGGVDTLEEKDCAMAVAKGLTGLIHGASVGELACMEMLIGMLRVANVVNNTVTTVLWDWFAGRVPGMSEEIRVCACMLVAMIAKYDASSVAERVDILLVVGLNDLKYARWACVALCGCCDEQQQQQQQKGNRRNESGNSKSTRRRTNKSQDNEIEQGKGTLSAMIGPNGDSIVKQIVERLCVLCERADDLSVVEQAVNAIYAVAPHPENVMSSVIKQMAKRLHNNSGSTSSSSNNGTDNSDVNGKVDVRVLSRFFVVIGHTAVKQLVRVERMVSQLRKRASSTRGKEQSRNDNEDNNNDDDDDDDEERMAMEADYALEEAEKELISPNSFIGRYCPLVRKIVRDEKAPGQLRACAVLCIAKLMCVEKKLCEKNLRLLFSVLASKNDDDANNGCNSAVVRANAVTALGDLTFRFPNLVEPWSARIYGALSDVDDMVRKNTLMVLSHLILNDMIKVKGHIVNMAVCILDKNERIADLARLFFHELGRKSVNAIYNILPDLISCMSKMENLSSDDFKTVVAFLIPLMDKEKHADGMVEKLCHRFRTSESERENRDLAYCISQLNISAKGLQKLNDNFKSFSVAIIDDQVHECMLMAFEKGHKHGIGGASSTTSQTTYEELTAKVNAVRSASGKNEDVDSVATAVHKQRGDAASSNTVSSSANRNEDGEDMDNVGQEDNSASTTATRSARARGRARGRGGGAGAGTRGRGRATRNTRPKRRSREEMSFVVEDSDSEGVAEPEEPTDIVDMAEDDETVVSRPRRTTRKRGVRVVESSESESSGSSDDAEILSE